MLGIVVLKKITKETSKCLGIQKIIEIDWYTVIEHSVSSLYLGCIIIL